MIEVIMKCYDVRSEVSEVVLYILKRVHCAYVFDECIFNAKNWVVVLLS